MVIDMASRSNTDPMAGLLRKGILGLDLLCGFIERDDVLMYRIWSDEMLCHDMV
jgi:hypothetical protein